MMKNYETDDTFLGRWIAGELSEEELVAFKETEAYKQFIIINNESQLLDGPDIDTEKALKTVKQRIGQKHLKPKTIKLWQAISVAAILIIAMNLLLNSSKTYTNGIGESQIIVLEDGSEINLNANSSLSLKRFFWSNDKTVNLEGEAYFTINKGDDFKVETAKGTIKVLGTEFNVKDRSYFEVKCFEGRVEFIPNNDSSSSRILTKGKQVIIKDTKIEDLIFKEEFPSWTKGISKFDEKPMYLVLEELTQYFDINFESTNININRLYSGSFNHIDLDLALKATLVPMGINYRKSKTENTFILSE
ncbi:possible anti-sigma factor [Flavobacteriales bacterium ALC-1]|nr:possible anti-sigma factor [Flavobacteriales bacterium ALC-1]